MLVPIYDGRFAPKFRFKKDLKKIHQLPLFKKGKEELPEGSAAVVAYTANTYIAEGGKKCLSTNIQWVLVLGVPGESDDEEDD